MFNLITRMTEPTLDARMTIDAAKEFISKKGRITTKKQMWQYSRTKILLHLFYLFNKVFIF